MRTLSRTVFQLSDAVRDLRVWRELSAVYGQRNWDLARKLHRSACQASLFLALLVSITLAISGTRIFALWTRGRIVMDIPTFYIATDCCSCEFSLECQLRRAYGGQQAPSIGYRVFDLHLRFRSSLHIR